MNIDEMITRALNEEFEEELKRYEQMPDHVFSKKFEKKMNKVIKEANKNKKQSKIPAGKIPLRKAWLFSLIILLSLLALTGAALIIVKVIESFIVEQHDIYSILNVSNLEGCPDTLEERYDLVIDTSNYEMNIVADLPYIYWIEYTNSSAEKWVSFEQDAKREFQGARLNTENCIGGIEEIQIDEYYAVYFETYYGEKCLIWDNGDYIFSISAKGFGKNDLIEMVNFVQKIE